MKKSLNKTKWVVVISCLSACQGVPKKSLTEPLAIQKNGGITVIRYEYEPGEMTDICKAAISKTQGSIDELIKIDSNLRWDRFDQVMTEFSDITSPLVFMGSVNTNLKLREEGNTCEKTVSQFAVGVFTRRDLYQALLAAQAEGQEKGRLKSETIRSFEQNGLKLDDSNLAMVRQLREKLAIIEQEFSQNLNEDKSTVKFTEAELKGVTEDFLKQLKKEGLNYIVTTKEPSYVQVMENASIAETRKRMMFAYVNRQTEKNMNLMSQAIEMRRQIAKLMGFSTWADERTDGRMAKNAKTVQEFLNNLRGKLAKAARKDLDSILTYKKKHEPKSTELFPWDVGYYSNLIKKEKYKLDKEKIREYFPSHQVVAGMFDVYSTLLGVTYREVKQANTWSPDVVLYEVLDAGKVVAYFYADFIPREGKYGHAAAFPLISGRKTSDGYSLPVASIVANFTSPTAGKPSLLSHDEVETVFHEFGHIMHQVLTRAPYGSLSGTSVAQDFVEAPSQMLENWVWDAKIISQVSGHYKNTKKKLPGAMLKAMLKAKDFNRGYAYTRQLYFALMDMILHTSKEKLDLIKIQDSLYLEMFGMSSIEGGHFLASFGHLMGGYDAGYYGYLWSEVYADDMFTRFQKNGLLNAKVGGDYRRWILENGNMIEAMDILRGFLGRDPNSKAFFKKLGIKS